MCVRVVCACVYIYIYIYKHMNSFRATVQLALRGTCLPKLCFFATGAEQVPFCGTPPLCARAEMQRTGLDSLTLQQIRRLGVVGSSKGIETRKCIAGVR